MLHIAGMPPVYDRWLNGVVPAWASLKADRIDALRGMPRLGGRGDTAGVRSDGRRDCLQSPIVQNALVLMRAADEADGLELTARGNLTLGTVSAMREAMDWPGCLFEQKLRAGKRLREGHVEELRLLRELVTMDSLLDPKGRQAPGRGDRAPCAQGRTGARAEELLPELLLGGKPRACSASPSAATGPSRKSAWRCGLFPRPGTGGRTPKR